MSRRHHGRPHHARHRPEAPRPTGQAASASGSATTGKAAPDTRPISTTDAPDLGPARPRDPRPVADRVSGPTVLPGERIAAKAGESSGPARPASPTPPREAEAVLTGAAARPATDPAGSAPSHATGPVNGVSSPPSNGCTAPQLRRFIKSRPYVPMHELRRRFGIAGTDDDVTQVRLEREAIYVGLPAREGALLGELLRGGEIGCELSLDPRTPVVIGVYPMRPVPRG
jgi:hypothetical protein